MYWSTDHVDHHHQLAGIWIPAGKHYQLAVDKIYQAGWQKHTSTPGKCQCCILALHLSALKYVVDGDGMKHVQTRLTWIYMMLRNHLVARPSWMKMMAPLWLLLVNMSKHFHKSWTSGQLVKCWLIIVPCRYSENITPTQEIFNSNTWQLIYTVINFTMIAMNYVLNAINQWLCGIVLFCYALHGIRIF